MSRPYIVRKVRFSGDLRREPGRPNLVWAGNAEEATEKIKNHRVDGGLIHRADGVYQGFHSFNIMSLTDTLVEVIPVKDLA